MLDTDCAAETKGKEWDCLVFLWEYCILYYAAACHMQDNVLFPSGHVNLCSSDEKGATWEWSTEESNAVCVEREEGCHSQSM